MNIITIKKTLYLREYLSLFPTIISYQALDSNNYFIFCNNYFIALRELQTFFIFSNNCFTFYNNFFIQNEKSLKRVKLLIHFDIKSNHLLIFWLIRLLLTLTTFAFFSFILWINCQTIEKIYSILRWFSIHYNSLYEKIVIKCETIVGKYEKCL